MKHDAVHTVEYGLASSTDETILMRAATESRIVVTSDADFGELLAQTAATQPSVILFRRTSGKPSEESLLALEAGGIVVVDPRRVRIRKLPIGNQDE